MEFDALPIGRVQLESNHTPGAEIDKHHVALQKQAPSVILRDYAFVAMRKTREQPFRIPVQRLYAG